MAELLDSEQRPRGEFSGFVRRLTWTLVALNLLILVLHIVFYQFAIWPESFLKSMFDMGTEANVPTWFATILWFLVSAAALTCYCVERRKPVKAWTTKFDGRIPVITG